MTRNIHHPETAINEQINTLTELSKLFLRATGTLQPCAIIFKNQTETDVISLVFEDQKEKLQAFNHINQIARIENPEAITYIMDIFYLIVPRDEDPTKQERPSLNENRKEAIGIITLRRFGKIETKLYPYIRHPHGEIEFTEPPPTNNEGGVAVTELLKPWWTTEKEDCN